MPTTSLKDHLIKASDLLAQAGIENPIDEAEFLMEWALDCSRPELRMRLQEQLPSELESTWIDWVNRRAQREPAQHIIGRVNFMGYEFYSAPQALIPRPETELLVVEAKRILSTRQAPGRFLELGIGTGCVSISLCLECSAARGVGLEISTEALALAARNLLLHNNSNNQIQDRLHWMHSNAFQALKDQIPPEAPFDLLVSNPPYIPKNEIETLQEEVRNHDPSLALDGGLDGLDFYRLIAEEGKVFLSKGGWAALEIGEGQDEAIRSIFLKENWVVEPTVLDYNRIPRIFLAHL